MSKADFSNRVVVVTGAGGGLGRSYAHAIANKGGSVVVNDLGGNVAGNSSGSASLADCVVDEIKSAGGRAVANYASVASTQGAEEIIEQALSEFGRIDAVINNAGNMRFDLFHDAKPEDLEALLSVHLVGSYNVAKAAWPHMQKQGYGRLVFTASSAGLFGSALYSGYGSAKAGVAGLVNVLAIEGREQGILCNGLMPTALSRMTDVVQERLNEGGSNVSQPPPGIENSMQPEFTAGLAAYLASEACSYTGEFYSSCAGRMARVFVGATTGWQGSRSKPSSIDDIAGHIDEIRDLSRGVHIPSDAQDEFRIVLTQADPLI